MSVSAISEDQRQLLSSRAAEKRSQQPGDLDLAAILPVELCAQIFWLSCQFDFWGHIRRKAPPDSKGSRIITPLVLGAVSRRWRAIVRSAPEIWDTVHLVLDEDRGRLITQQSVLKDWLRRSWPHPITISLTFNRKADGETWLESERRWDEPVIDSTIAMYKDLAACSHRWRFIRVDVPKIGMRALNEGVGSAPFLEGVSIKALGDPSDSSDELLPDCLLDFATKTVTGLEFMGSQGIPACLGQSRLESLTHLTFVYTSRGCFISALKNAPNLTHCSILFPGSSRHDSYFDPLETKVTMTALQSLTLFSPTWGGLKSVLDHLTLPEMEDFQISHPNFPHFRYGRISVYLKKTQCVKLRRLTLQKFTLWHDMEPFDFSSFPLIEDVEIAFTSPHSRCLAFVMTLLCPKDYESRLVEDRDLLPRLKRLVIRGCCRTATPTINAEIMLALERRAFHNEPFIDIPGEGVRRAKIQEFVMVDEGDYRPQFRHPPDFSPAARQMMTGLVDRGVRVVIGLKKDNDALLSNTRTYELDTLAQHYECK